MAEHGHAEHVDLDGLLQLEEDFYAEGHALGVADGSHAGRVEGRLFGMQKGFERFAAMGALAGRCALWEAAVDSTDSKTMSSTVAVSNSRLPQHLSALSALTELASLDTQNTEEAIADFDERLKRAEAKAKIVSITLGEKRQPSTGSTGGAKNANIEDFAISRNLKPK